MKENRKNNYLIKYVVVLAILIAMTILACAIPKGIDLNVDDTFQETSTGITNTAYNVIYPTSGGLGQFDDGTVYVYTDPTKVESAHAGTINNDLSLVTVDITYPHGAQKNPYVINTLADWETFVKQMATGTTYGAGEYFVLARDLDFDGVTFHGVKNFSGNFYGSGFALKNISCNGAWQYWTGSSYSNMPSTNYGVGVFCNTSGVVITDLIVQDYEYLDMQRTSTFAGDRGSCAGGVVGFSTGECYILNCHTIGSISSHNVSYSVHTPWGGIIGEHYSSAPITIYRCSGTLETYANYSGGYVPIFGGIIGESYNVSAPFVHIYDCVASITAVIASSAYVHIGCIGGIIYANTFSMENIVAEAVITASAKTASGAMMYTNKITSMKLSNIYVGASIGASGATKLPFYMLITQALTSSNSQLSNLHLVKPSALSYAPLYSGQANSFTSSSPAQPTLQETYADIYAQAQQDLDDSILSSKIWDKSKIGGYTPADTPVRNFLTANITFKNLLSGGGEEGVGIATAEYRAGDTLPSPSGSYLKTNHTFRGWTTDKTGKSDP
ncbi:MAG: hypothetical protein K2I46_00170, partial [Clostridia bacterium]|nr:hypothetical protein [Clostridia bacterium]